MENSKFITLVKDAIKKLETQGVPAGNSDHCYYSRTLNDGTEQCCIVGHMMPEDVRKDIESNFKGSTIQSVKLQDNPWVSQLTNKQIRVLSKLQHVHDTWTYDHDVCYDPKEVERLRDKAIVDLNQIINEYSEELGNV